jgi:hypothetical protein
MRSADVPTGYVSSGYVALTLEDRGPVYFMREDSTHAGRYASVAIRPGTYRALARAVGFAPVGDTITLRADVTDSAVYRIPSQIYLLCEDVRTR